jgi:glycosyltransferase involved in cell wall biosynthesis
VRIIFLIRSLNFGGAERQLVALSTGLYERDYSVKVAVFSPDGPLEGGLRKSGVPLIVLDKKGRWDIFVFLWRLVRLIRHEKPDILHGYLPVPNLLTILLKPVFPRVRMVWGVRASNMELDRYDWLARFIYRIECILSRFADLIICNSNAGKEYAAKNGFPVEKMVVIPNGIDTARFRPDTAARERLRAEWGLNNDQKLIGLVGRLDPMKDHPTFIRAAALLSEQRQDVRFVCVGDGPQSYRSELHSLARDVGLDGKLIWTGARGDMPSVYNALDIAVSSSSFGEGFPNVIGEAMSCGIPCVVTNVGDATDIVGDLGKVVPTENPTALAKALNDALSTTQETKDLESQKIRNRIVSHFGKEVLLSRTIRALDSLFR